MKKLSTEQVREIIARHSAGETMRSLAREYGVSHVAIRKHVKRSRLNAWLEANARTPEQQALMAKLLASLMRRDITISEACRTLMEAA